MQKLFKLTLINITLLGITLISRTSLATEKNKILKRYSAVGIISGDKGKHIALIKDHNSGKTQLLEIGQKLRGETEYKLVKAERRNVQISNGTDTIVLTYGFKDDSEPPKTNDQDIWDENLKKIQNYINQRREREARLRGWQVPGLSLYPNVPPRRSNVDEYSNEDFESEYETFIENGDLVEPEFDNAYDEYAPYFP